MVTKATRGSIQIPKQLAHTTPAALEKKIDFLTAAAPMLISSDL